MEAKPKKRTPSRCREWERQRRNKFNDAIAELGEVVRAINKANDPSGKADIDHVQIPKIDIIQKAVICLKACDHEKTLLKAEILALQVKLESTRSNYKDVATQVYFGINKKLQSNKHETHVKQKSLTKESVPAVTAQKRVDKVVPSAKSNRDIKPLPKLFPLYKPCDKKGQENTIVVLPATPYIFPPRHLLFPTVTPTFVIVDPNVQSIKKSSIPILKRNGGDITKTTMVNILPIAAYSRPLSATKTKKNNVKGRSETRKITKKLKCDSKGEKESLIDEKNKPQVTSKDSNNIDISKEKELIIQDSTNSKIEMVSTSNSNENMTNKKDNTTDPEIHNEVPANSSSKLDIATNVDEIKNSETQTKHDPITERKSDTSSTSPKEIENIVIKKNTNDIKKVAQVVKDIVTTEKDKDKLPSLLDTSLCENTVDGGNARLELAEEFLAASPTAAFLMTFPLVSGNRADSPADEPQNPIQATSKDTNQRRNEVTQQPVPYFEKPNLTDSKVKSATKSQPLSSNTNKQNEEQKYINNTPHNKQLETKIAQLGPTASISTENPFLNLPMPSLISTNCTLTDSTFSLDFDCNLGKSIPSQPTSYVNNSNFFYKGDPFSTVKNTIYSTSSISSGHEFNSLGLYPCAMEKYSSKNKSDYPNVEDNLMKIGSSRLTYDIDLGWSHKSFDFVNCTTNTNTFNKDNILTSTSTSYSTSYNPFNPEFHMPLVTNSNKKDVCNKPPSSFAETMTNFYSQSAGLWSDDVLFHSSNSASKSLTSKHQNYLPVDHGTTINNSKPNIPKQYEIKPTAVPCVDNQIKTSNVGIIHQGNDKFTKKSPTKTHINWMTSEIRPMQNTCNTTVSHVKGDQKLSYVPLENINKKHDQNEGNYFPISMHNFSTQPAQEEFPVWSSARPLGTTEISIEPPPINLPTLVGDLALGPHDRKKNIDSSGRGVSQTDLQNCSNFLSVTQLMNRSNDMTSRYPGFNVETSKASAMKQSNIIHYNTEYSRKAVTSRLENNVTQSCPIYNEPRTVNSYENNMGQFLKTKSTKTDKAPKTQKTSYSAESLIRGGGCNPKVPESNSGKFLMPPQKYNDFNTPHESGIAQVSHYPPILDYTDNGFAGQQFSGTTLYNSTTNTISNSFYSNLMPGSSNLMSGNYTGGAFAGDFIDYNQTAECNFTNHKYDELKMRNNPMNYLHQDKNIPNYKSSRRESTKHKLECSKKDSNKKYQNKRPKINNEVEEWNDGSHVLWQNKTPSKRHPNLISEDIPFPNYVGNQMTSQYQPEFLNSHIMPSNVQSMGHNVDRSLTGLPVTSRANFNLSTIFPEITMKVQ